MRRTRLTDNDTHIGPITIGERDKRHRPLSIGLDSGCEEYPGCSLMLRAFGWPVRIALPPIIKPWREWRDTSRYDWANPGDGYWATWRREYSIYVNDGALHLYYGPQTHDSLTSKSKCMFLPWKQWRHVRHSFYNLQGEHFWTEPKGCSWESMDAMRQLCPTVKFLIEDFDGAHIAAETRIEEREWRRGDKWCSWLSIFWRPKIRRSLHIGFEKEVGRDKGSWKGGMMGTGIDMLPGELHADAFRRYCAQEVRSKNGPSRIKFIGVNLA